MNLKTKKLRIDLGCGATKTENFLGVDRFALPGVDVVANLDEPLPFPDNSVDYVVASHSLEHINDLPATMGEIYRICRDRAIVTVVAPYHATFLNQANPYHKQVFNEHTARFFSKTESISTIPEKDYTFPHATIWGLSESDYSEHAFDIRPLRQEFFYFDQFRHLPEDAKRVLRQHLNNVCDQMVIHAVVVKTPIDDRELQNLAISNEFIEPASLRDRRNLENTLPASNNIFANLLQVAESLNVVEIKSRLAEIEALIPKIETLEVQSARAGSIIPQIESQVATLNRNQTGLATALRTASDARPHNFFVRPRRGIKRLIRQIKRREDLSPLVAPPFKPLLEASILSNFVSPKHQLTLSEVLDPRVLVSYPLPTRDFNAATIDIAVSALKLLSGTNAILNYDIYDERAQRVLCVGRTRLSVDMLDVPVRLPLPPIIIDPSSQISLRFAGSPELSAAKIRIYEWQRVRLTVRGVRFDRQLFGRMSKA